MKNFEYTSFDLSKWDFRDFATFLQCADPTFVLQPAGSDDAMDDRARNELRRSVHIVNGLCVTGPDTPVARARVEAVDGLSHVKPLWDDGTSA